MAKKRAPKSIESLTHPEASRKNIPTAEYQTAKICKTGPT